MRILPPVLLLAGAMALESLRPERREEGEFGGRISSAGGQGMMLAVLGGYRALAADVLWLRANVAWESRDAERTEALVRATVAADGRPEYFRLNGARIIAFDLPTWTTTEEPVAVRVARQRTYAERAMELLEAGLEQGGPNAAYWIEMGRIADRVMGERGRAAEYYGRAAEVPGAPLFAGRLRVELLVKEGRLTEARDWLRDWLPWLPADDAGAEKGRMEARLAEIERRLSGAGPTQADEAFDSVRAPGRQGALHVR